MAANTSTTAAQVARIVRQCLERGGTVDIDGLGSFRRGPDGRFAFLPQTRPRVFLAYVIEDRAAAERLFEALLACGFDPWLDTKKLLPGQNWTRAIEQAIAVCDFFIACLSRRAAGKRSRFQSELRCALECAGRQPLDQVFFIPVRLEDCVVPARLAQEFQYVDLFPDWERGLARVVGVMRGLKPAAG